MENMTFDCECMGIKFNAKDMKPLDGLFNEIYNNGEDRIVYESKKIYTHDCDDDLRFDYKYALDCCVYGDDKCYVSYTLYLVPMFMDLCDKAKKDILNFTGLDDGTMINSMDVINYGYGVIMGYEGDEFDDWDEFECFDGKKIEMMANIPDFIDFMRGFYLDRHYNRIGSTGWDTLNSAIHGTDMFRPALDRAEEAMKA